MACRLGGWTYEEVLLNPIADALAATLSSERRVWIAMQVRRKAEGQEGLHWT